jgi:hypothetical protein
LPNSSGSFAIFAAIRRASFLVRSLLKEKGRLATAVCSVSDGEMHVRAPLGVLWVLPVGDVLLAAPVLVRDVDDGRDHVSRDSGGSHQEKPHPVNSWDMRAHVNWLAL